MFCRLTPAGHGRPRSSQAKSEWGCEISRSRRCFVDDLMCGVFYGFVIYAVVLSGANVVYAGPENLQEKYGDRP